MIPLLPHLDLGRAILAIIISIALYAAVQREQNPPDTGTLDVAVELANIPPGLLVLGEEPARSVQARVSAPREMWPGLRPNTLRAVVDLSRATASGDHFYPVEINPPDPRVRVLEVIPPQISVRLDQTIDRAVPVRLNRAGSIPFGYEAGEVVIEPTTVTVSGPASVVRRVDMATVEVRLDGTTVNVDGRYRPVPVDAQGQAVGTEGILVRVSPANVRVQIQVTQQLSYKTVGVQPDIIGTPQAGFIIEGVAVDPSAVTIVGGPQALAAVNFATTERVDATDATSTFARQVSIIVPEGTSIVQEGFARVTVRLSELDLAQSIVTLPVAENLSPELEILSPLPSLQIIIRGAPLALRALQGTDFRATLNLDNLPAGSHQVAVAVTAPPGIAVQSVNPRVMTVTLGSSATPPSPSPTPTAAPTATRTATPTPRPSPEPTPGSR